MHPMPLTFQTPIHDIMITIFGLVSRLFLKGLREKVMRGMHGAAGRGTSLGKLSLGFTRRVFRSESGNAVYDADGLPTYDICIDPTTCADRLRLNELFVVKQLTPFEIARQFNAENVDGWNGWTASGIKNLLRNPSAIGVFIWNKTRRELDPETGEWTIKENPRSEWTVKYRPELAIVTKDLWRSTRKRLAQLSRKRPPTGRAISRNQISATTLFSGTLFCESCGSELKLIRSSEKYKQLGCMNGPTQGHDCKMSSSKSVRVIEECLLSYLREVLLTDTVIEKIVLKANSLLEGESHNATVDIVPLKAKERAIASKITKFVRLIEESDDQTLTSGYSKRVAELERELRDVKVAIRNANVENSRRPQPLEMEQARAYLANLRSLFNRDTAEAAAAIRLVTGPISIREEKIPDRSRVRWIATFQPQWNKIVNRIANDGSEAPVAESGLDIEKVEVLIEKIPQYVQLAEKFKGLHSQGTSIAALASAHGMAWKQAADIVHFAETGESPKWPAHQRTGRGQRTRYTEIAPQVVGMRDRHISFAKIAADLNVSENTVRRAYDYGRPEPAKEAAESSTTISRGRYSHLPPEVFDVIRQKIHEGKKNQEIGAEVGCSESTVLRVRKSLQPDKTRNEAG